MPSTPAAVCGPPVIITGFALGALTALAGVILALLAYMWWYDNHRKPHRPYGNPCDADGYVSSSKIVNTDERSS